MGIGRGSAAVVDGAPPIAAIVFIVIGLGVALASLFVAHKQPGQEHLEDDESAAENDQRQHTGSWNDGGGFS